LPVLFLRILIIWYSSQSLCVRWGSYTSSSFNVSNGVRQGGVLSPVLLNVYMDELSAILRSSQIGCSISSHFYNHFFYADDLVLLSPSPKGLQKLINLSFVFSTDHSIAFNPLKPVCMSILPPQCRSSFSSPKITLDGRQLLFKTSCKYLGVFINNSFTDDSDILRQQRSFYIRCNYLCRNFIECSHPVKCALFTAFCSNIYAGHCWNVFKRSSMHTTTVAFNNCFRRFLGYPRFCSASAMYVFNNAPPLSVILRKSIFSFRSRILASTNTLIHSLCTYVFNSHLWNHWNAELFTFCR